MQEISYGWVDQNNNKYKEELDINKYILQNPRELRKNKVGVCWDQVELERYYFKSNDLNIKTFFLIHYDNDRFPTHTFLTYEKNNKYYWFEHAWEAFRGIHEYNSLEELLLDIQNKFIKYELNDKYVANKLVIYEYKKPKYNISVNDSYKHCEAGKIIKVEEV